MASYRIRVHDSVQGPTGLRVLLLDECEQAMGELEAFNPNHARLIAHDLMALVRHRDPKGIFVLDTHVERPAA